jgi:hypothetical protein
MRKIHGYVSLYTEADLDNNGSLTVSLARRKGKEQRKSGRRTHTFCYPDSCPKPVSLEGPAQSPSSVSVYHH